MKKWLIGSVLLILAVIALMFLLSGRKKADDGIKLVKVKRGDIAERALAVGTIEPEKEIDDQAPGRNDQGNQIAKVLATAQFHATKTIFNL